MFHEGHKTPRKVHVVPWATRSGFSWVSAQYSYGVSARHLLAEEHGENTPDKTMHFVDQAPLSKFDRAQTLSEHYYRF